MVASKIADRVGITRSVIVNALRKFESAGVIESRSSGMKGTYIKVVNDYVFTELDKIKEERKKLIVERASYDASSKGERKMHEGCSVELREKRHFLWMKNSAEKFLTAR